MRLTLLIPELLWSEPGDTEANVPAENSALAKILAQRHFEQQTNEGWEASLVRVAGLHSDSSIALLRAAGEAECPNANMPLEPRQWLCADPVHLRFHQDRLILADGHELALSQNELRELNVRLNDAFTGRAEFFLTSPTRGYVRLAKAPGAKSPATSQIASFASSDAGSPSPAGQALSRKIGCEVRPGDFGCDAELRGLANEIQMLLHADPVNLSRAAAGKPAINALWLWGSGETPRIDATEEQKPVDAVFGHHPLVKGIAKMLGTPEISERSADSQHLGQASLPTLAALQSGKTRHALFFIDTLSTPTHYQNSLDYATAWQTIDQTQLMPAFKALRQWRLSQLNVVAPVAFGELHWKIKPLAAWSGGFWRRRWLDLVTALASQSTAHQATTAKRSSRSRAKTSYTEN